ncbi:MAG: peptidylprolyl isomerase [Agriterribacter sp.]
MKKPLIVCLLLFCSTCLAAQTLFTYGKHAVDKEEFLKAFHKNNPGDHSSQALRDYLDLYIAFKLKVQAAKDSKLDTAASQKNELLNFRRQIEDDYLSDDSSVNALCKEAFDRSLRDIRVSHIFIPFNPSYVNGPSTFFSTETEDTASAFAAIQKAYKELQQGADFGVVAEKYSLDPSVKSNKGDIGFITVFTLPYLLENIAYRLHKGDFSQPYKSNVGYHILKKTEERPAFGQMKAAQILLSYPPNITTGEKQVLLKRADSLYKALQQGASFELLAKQFSSERTVQSTGGVLTPDFSIGKYDPVFERAVVQLKNDGDYTLPFETGYGVHIVKRLAHVAPATDNSQAIALFKNNVLQDARMKVSHDNQDKKILELIQYKFVFKSKALLWQITDSLLRNPGYLPAKNITAENVVFTFSKEQKTVGDWWTHIQTIRNNYRPGTALPYEAILQHYAAATARIYYKQHWEDYNPAFKNQLD